MKKYSIGITFLFLLIGLLQAQSSMAQVSNACCMPANGYWEVITNDKEPLSVTVKYYDLQKHLLYQEHLTGVSLDLNKKRICRALNSRLKAALKLSAAII